MTAVSIPTRPGMGRSLIDHDPRSRAFPARALLTGAPARQTRTWRRGAAYDQGQTSTCVAQSFKGVLNTAPASAVVPYATRTRYDAVGDFYPGAQRNDQWPGEEPAYQGTSALGMCRYLALKGVIHEYRWCFGLDDVLDTLSALGPVAIGVNWRERMFYPDPDGLIHPGGSVAGGHEVELIGLDVSRRRVTGMNSWGALWGDRGRFYLSWDDLALLLDDEGDATTLVGL